jgi:hypothetical protein
MSLYLERTCDVFKFMGKTSLSFIGHFGLGVIIVPTFAIIAIQLPAEYIITGETKNVEKGFDFIDNCKNTLHKIWD